MRAVRVALVRQRYTPFGGAERFIESVFEGLSQTSRFEFSLVSREWPRLDVPAAERNSRVFICNPFHIGRVWRLWAFSRCVGKVIEREAFDLVQSHERLPQCDIFRAGDGVHKEWLMQRGRTLSRVHFWLLRLSPFHRLMLHLERRTFQSPRLKLVIANSSRVRNDLLRHYPDIKAKVQVIHNGVNLERFHPQLHIEFRSAVRERLGLKDSDFVALLVGSGFDRKGLEVALRALPIEVHLVVVGRDRHSSRFRRLSHQLGLSNRVHFTGPQPDVRPYYGMADLFILPSLYDPFPNSALEAMASGLPVIVSNACGTADLLDKRFVLDALDIRAWRDAISNTLLENRDGAIGRHSREIAEGFGLDQMSGALRDIYLDLLEK